MPMMDGVSATRHMRSLGGHVFFKYPIHTLTLPHTPTPSHTPSLHRSHILSLLPSPSGFPYVIAGVTGNVMDDDIAGYLGKKPSTSHPLTILMMRFLYLSHNLSHLPITHTHILAYIHSLTPPLHISQSHRCRCQHSVCKACETCVTDEIGEAYEGCQPCLCTRLALPPSLIPLSIL